MFFMQLNSFGVYNPRDFKELSFFNLCRDWPLCLEFLWFFGDISSSSLTLSLLFFFGNISLCALAKWSNFWGKYLAK